MPRRQSTDPVNTRSRVRLLCGGRRRTSHHERCREVSGIAVRQHQAVHYASLFRFDDILLANTHAAGVWACHSPVLQLRRTCSTHLFDFYLRSFDRIWGPDR